MRVKTLLAFVAVALLLCAPAAFGQNLLTNGGFETGDFTGWTTGGNFGATGVTSGAFYEYTGAEEGTYYAYLGPVGSDATLSQSFTTQAGTSYTFSFWLAAVGDNPSDFSAYWDGNQVYSVTNPNTNGVWTQYSFTETGTGNDTITLSFRDDPAYIALDNVSVTANTGGSVPEPSSFLLLGSGALGLAGFIRRKFRS
jgi:Carbohydrate binding domain/PEP-CTERM motif